MATTDKASSASAPASASSSNPTLTAVYNSSTNAPFTYEEKLPSIETTSTADRVKYLSALRKATANLQDHINKELTQRMEEDNKRSVESGKPNGVAVDEGKEEENYGEEVVEEE